MAAAAAEEKIESNESQFYTVKPQKTLGAIVVNIDLGSDKLSLSTDLINQIKEDIAKYKLLIFKQQGCKSNNIVAATRMVKICKLFDDIDEHMVHYNSPHPAIDRISNDKHYGLTNVGRNGWHIDGLFGGNPYLYLMLHIISVPKKGYGQTAWIQSNDVLSQIQPKQRSLWDRIYLIGLNEKSVFPLICKHPITKQETLCFHLGFNRTVDRRYLEIKQGFQDKIDPIKDIENILNKWNEGFIIYDKERTNKMNEEIKNVINICCDKDLNYNHEYECGDLLIADNLAMIHEAVASTQSSVEEIGLRILDRICIVSQCKAKK